MTQVVVVTGASTGIGEATALRLARSGWHVLAGVRRPEDGERLAKEADTDRLEPLRLDVTSEFDIKGAAERVDELTHGDGLAGLVNNAGIAIGGPVEFLGLDRWRQQLEVNVVGQVAVTKALLPALRRAKGRLIFVGSLSGRVSTPMTAPYNASKHAIEAIAEALRHELKPWSIKVSVIEPGAVNTPIWEKGRETAAILEDELGDEAMELYRDRVEQTKRGIDMQERKGVHPDKVAAVIEQALTTKSPRARYLVGTDAKMAGFIARFLPDRLRDVAMDKALP